MDETKSLFEFDGRMIEVLFDKEGVSFFPAKDISSILALKNMSSVLDGFDSSEKYVSISYKWRNSELSICYRKRFMGDFISKSQTYF